MIFAASSVNAQDLNESGSDLTADEGMPISDMNQNDELYVESSPENSQEILSDDVPISDNLPTVESGVVSGGVDITAVHPWAPSNSSGNWGNVSYVIPVDASDIKFAYVYVSIYSGNAQPSYGSIADINVTIDNDLILNTSEVLWISTGSTDGVNYIVNDHITKCYSDYMIFYNITDSVQGLQGNTISVDVLSKPLQGKNFDGRIKLVSVVLAYDDGDEDIINYWFNAGQAWTNRDIYSYFATENLELGDEYNSTLINIALSSIDGQYILNNDHLFDSEEDISGAYYQYHRWDVNDYMVEGETTELKYIASEDGWGSFKAVMSLLTIQQPHVEPVIPKNETVISIVGDADKKQIKATLTDVNGIPIANVNMSYSINDGEFVNVLCKNGSFVLDNLIGDVRIVVTYAGNETYNASSSDASFSFPKLSSKMMVTSIDGAKLELTCILIGGDGNPIGGAIVYYTLNGADKNNVTSQSNGEFNIMLQNNVVLAITFEGNDVYMPSNTTITIKNIRPVPKDTIIVVEKAFKRYAVDYNAGERGYKFYFTLTDGDGNILSEKPVKIGVDGKIYNVKTDKEGKAGLMINLATSNFYTYGISFLGDDDYKASFEVSRLNVVKKDVTITPAKTSYTFSASAKTKTITATLKSINQYIPSGKQVTITVAGKTFKATIGTKGQISLNIGAATKKGTYKATINFAGTGTYAAANSKTITVKIS